ncbi:MAG TPA: hypothetical protein QF813_10740, partial [Alphaproteobacteria bacterium]|nr:hypothetical protein [Alphaproteobacteria bacterium]
MANRERPRTVQIPETVVARNQKLLAWVEEMAALAKPDSIHWCDGSQDEYDGLCARMVA